MSFWNTSDNSNAQQTGGAFETGGGDMEPIPAGTQVVAAIEEAKWDGYEGNDYISLKWRVLDGEFKKRVIYHKLYVRGDKRDEGDSEKFKRKADKGKRMLAAIATNAGGGLLQVEEEPKDHHLMQHLLNKLMVLMLQVWELEINGEERKGNWVSAVAPKNGAQPTAAKPKPAPAEAPIEGDGDLPF